MIRNKQKLALRTQTIALLGSNDLQTIHGGALRPSGRPPGSQCSYEESGCINDSKVDR